MTLKVAKSAGFCHGVKRAVEMSIDAAAQYESCVTLGPIIHNKYVTDDLKKRGVYAVSGISEIDAGSTVIIRSHGACKEEFEALCGLGINITDATCPDVKKIHDIVRRDSEAGRFIFVIGERDHPEITAICSWCERFAVFETTAEIKEHIHAGFHPDTPVSVVSQTTGTKATYDKFVAITKKECTNPIIYDTICNATYRRQAEAIEISQNADAVIVIGDEKSSNSLKLAEICKKHCSKVFFIQSAEDLELELFRGTDTVGITAGASTPAFIIKEVIAKMSNVSEEKIMDGTIAEQEETKSVSQPETLPVPEQEPEEDTQTSPPQEPADVQPDADVPSSGESADEEPADDPDENGSESFEELLEKSIKTLRTGDKVSGTVTSITGTEISVDLGTKQSGYIPISEFTDDENTDISEIINIGDTIEAFIIRVNDVEGMIMLSKKRLDAIKNWDVIMAAKESREIVQGFVIQENRGGIVVNVKGVHVFVPASQTGLSKDTPMSELLKKTVKLRINEVNQSRRRVIGSIRDAQKDERREKSEKLWNEIEVGKKYDGVVKSMTSYGVFVDIGGVDGMIHISELSWTRIKQPSEVLSIGDEISVYVISFDKDSRKISLGYKKGEDNPWTKFKEEYSVDDVVNVKIVKMMPFGAFAEICPGVDGLIHISQIAEHRVGLPSEILSEGQMVDAKITEIDNDRKKVSLSIKALLEPPARPAAADDAADSGAQDDTPQVVYDTDTPPPPDSEEPGPEPEPEPQSEQEKGQ